MAGPLNLPSTIKPTIVEDRDFNFLGEYVFDTRLSNAILIDLRTSLTTKTIIISENIDPLSYILIRVINNLNNVHIRVRDFLGNTIIDPVLTNNFIMIGNPEQNSTEWITYINADSTSTSASGLSLGTGVAIYAGMSTDSYGNTSVLLFKSLIAGSNISLTTTGSSVFISSSLTSAVVNATNIGIPSFGLFASNVGGYLRFKSLIAGSSISLSATATGVQINSTLTSVVSGATNLGIPSFGLFGSNNGGILQFKSLIAGSSISLSATASGLQINSSASGSVTGATNVGIPSFGLFTVNNAGVLEFKSLIAGSSIALTSTSTGVQINSTGGGMGFSTGTNIGVPTFGLFSDTVSDTLRFKSLTAGSNIALIASASGVQVNTISFGTITSATNLGVPSFGLFASVVGEGMQFKSLTAGSNVALIGTATGVQINTSYSNIVSAVTNIGIPSFGLFFQNASGTLQFKSLIGGSAIVLTATNSGVQINSTASTVVAAATNIGIPSFGLFFQNASGTLQFKSLIAGSNINLTATTSGVQIDATGGGGSVTGATNMGVPTFGLFSDLTGSTLRFKSLTAGTDISLITTGSDIRISATRAQTINYTYFPLVENSTINYAAIDMLSVDNNQLKAFPILYDSIIRGIYLYQYNPTAIAITASQTAIFQLGTVARGQALLAANFSSIGTVPTFTLDTTTDNNTYVSRCITGLNIQVPATRLLAMQINAPGAFHSNTTSSRYIMNVYTEQ